MSDQADGLRQLVQARQGAVRTEPTPREHDPPSTAQSLVFTSGKGGVGTSNLALNLAIALGERDQHVVLVDADFGLANLDLLCGLTPPLDLGDILADGRPLADAVVDGPAGIRILPGAHAMRTWLETLDDGFDRLVTELAELEADADFLLIDAGTGLGPALSGFAAGSDQVVIVTTPEPPALADAHATIGHLRRRGGEGPRLRAVVNQVRSRFEAVEVLDRLVIDSRAFLGAVVEPLGSVRADVKVPAAVRKRRAFITEFPGSIAARGVRRIAETLLTERQPRMARPGLFPALAIRRALGQIRTFL